MSLFLNRWSSATQQPLRGYGLPDSGTQMPIYQFAWIHLDFRAVRYNKPIQLYCIPVLKRCLLTALLSVSTRLRAGRYRRDTKEIQRGTENGSSTRYRTVPRSGHSLLSEPGANVLLFSNLCRWDRNLV